MKKIYDIFGGKTYFWLVTAVVVAAGFLRFYRLADFTTFLGDQGRDAIVIKDIATLKHYPALGPITSVGSIYLGPFYYYLMAPWLALFGLDPIGPSVGVAFISSVCIVLQYLAVKDLIDKRTALYSVILSAFSWVLVEYSRFSWNPNLLAPVSFFAIYSLIKAIRTNRIIWYFLTGALLSSAVQLHYLAVFLLPIVGFILIISLFRYKKTPWIIKLRGVAVSIAAFALILSPFLLFEAKHSFPNMRSVLNFMHENSAMHRSSSYYSELVDTINHLFTYSFQFFFTSIPVGTLLIIGYFIFPITVLLQKKHNSKKGRSLLIMTFVSIALLLEISIYHGPKYAHYLGAIYLLFYVETAFILSVIPYRVIRYILLTAFLYVNLLPYVVRMQGDGPRQILQARKVAQAISDLHPNLPYTLTFSPGAYADYPYRYFLDAWDKKPVPKEEDSYVPTNELYVICDKKCDPMKDSQWAIAHFSPQKITDEKIVDGVYIYRLTR